jgi:hypothetical protein
VRNVFLEHVVPIFWSLPLTNFYPEALIAIARIGFSVAIAVAIPNVIGCPIKQSTILANGGFETSLPMPTSTTAPPKDANGLSGLLRPHGWQEDSIGILYGLDRNTKRNGEHALKIGFSGATTPKGYSGAMQRIDATALRGKKLVFEAYLRRDASPAKVGLWWSLHDAERKRVHYENTYERVTITSNEWQPHRLEMKVSENAQTILVGVAIHEADGTMWVDDASVCVVE